MKIFALETDTEKLNRSFLSPGESIVLQARFHGFLFAMRGLIAFFFTMIILAVGIGANMIAIPASLSLTVLGVFWLIFVLRPLIRGFIDWQYDELVVTTEKIIIVNQSSLFRQEIEQMNLENLASVTAQTQYLGLFPFGKIHFDLKEGIGAQIRLRYIPGAQRVCSTISDCLVQYQRRRVTTPPKPH